MYAHLSQTSPAFNDVASAYYSRSVYNDLHSIDAKCNHGSSRG